MAVSLITWADVGDAYSWPFRVWSDGEYVYVAYNGTWDTYGLRVFSFDGAAFTLIDEVNNTGGRDYGIGVWGDGTYIYFAEDSSGLSAYTFDGAALTEVVNNAVFCMQVYADENYVYACGYTGLEIYTFDGSAFTEVDSVTIWSYASLGSDVDLAVNGNNIFVAAGDYGLKAFSFIDSVLKLQDTYIASYDMQSVVTDGTHIFAADDYKTMFAFSYENNELTLLDTYDFGSNAHGIMLHYADGCIFASKYDSHDPYGGVYQFAFIDDEFVLLDDSEATGVEAAWGVFAYDKILYLCDQYDELIGAYAYTVPRSVPEATILLPIHSDKAVILGAKGYNNASDAPIQVTNYKGRSDYTDVQRNQL